MGDMDKIEGVAIQPIAVLLDLTPLSNREILMVPVKYGIEPRIGNA